MPLLLGTDECGKLISAKQASCTVEQQTPVTTTQHNSPHPHASTLVSSSSDANIEPDSQSVACLEDESSIRPSDNTMTLGFSSSSPPPTHSHACTPTGPATIMNDSVLDAPNADDNDVSLYQTSNGLQSHATHSSNLLSRNPLDVSDCEFDEESCGDSHVGATQITDLDSEPF